MWPAPKRICKNPGKSRISSISLVQYDCNVRVQLSHYPEAEDEELEWKCTNVLDSLKFTASESESEDELEHDDATFQIMGVGEADLCAQLVNLAISAGDDPLGETWLPLREAKVNNMLPHPKYHIQSNQNFGHPTKSWEKLWTTVF
ncbi:hypothetical protein F5J12DRAFT_786317 [Pisolithus orientalis]|uniref:uncharacterized protein n=1 Tax=Pisolithus orientalis TaxID=936130 RepID=UPI0022259932|nr:uncharacterized protein F5J12DRAFT_786317 [Pisolithus orientalis]KAI5991671.1 hypothetical protein F5J12DRAFT_786317 [Pisolithus orientalis]